MLKSQNDYLGILLDLVGLVGGYEVWSRCWVMVGTGLSGESCTEIVQSQVKLLTCR